MRAFAEWLVTSDGVNLAYTIVLLAALVLPMAGLSYWYHRAIRRTGGGRRLMSAQNASAHRPTPYRNPGGQMRSAATLHKAVMSGDYGSEAKRMQITVYKVCAIWLATLAVLGALPFLAAWFAGV